MENTLVIINPAVTEEQIALCIRQQYNDIGDATRELVKRTLRFGVMFARAEVELDRRGLLRNRKDGQGLQGWLATHCPDVNYKTAMRWKGLAVRAANSLSCSSDAAFRLLCGEVIEVPAKVTERCDKIFEQSSLRQLTQQLFDFASDDRGDAGRPSGTASGTPTEHYTRVEAARRLWARPMSLISCNRQAFYSAAKLLPLDDARESLMELKQLCAALKTRIDETK